MRAQMCAQIGRVADQGGCTHTITENTNGAHMKHKENTQKTQWNAKQRRYARAIVRSNVATFCHHFQNSARILPALSGFCVGCISIFARILPAFCQDSASILLGFCQHVARVCKSLIRILPRICEDFTRIFPRIRPESCQQFARILPGLCQDITTLLPRFGQDFARILPGFARIRQDSPGFARFVRIRQDLSGFVRICQARLNYMGGTGGF